MKLNVIADGILLEGVTFLDGRNLKNGIHIVTEHYHGHVPSMRQFEESKGISRFACTIQLRHPLYQRVTKIIQLKFNDKLLSEPYCITYKDASGEFVQQIDLDHIISDLYDIPYVEREDMKLEKELTLEEMTEKYSNWLKQETKRVLRFIQPSFGFPAKKALSRHMFGLKATFYYDGLLMKYTYADFLVEEGRVRFMLVGESTKLLEGSITGVIEKAMKTKDYQKLLYQDNLRTVLAERYMYMEDTFKVEGKRMSTYGIPPMYKLSKLS